MKMIDLPFLLEWEPQILSGKKSATSRRTRYGYPGDYFEAFGARFILTVVCRFTLEHIARFHWWEEGCTCPEEFINVWTRLHPRVGFRPERKVYLHRFKPEAEYPQDTQ